MPLDEPLPGTVLAEGQHLEKQLYPELYNNLKCLETPRYLHRRLNWFQRFYNASVLNLIPHFPFMVKWLIDTLKPNPFWSEKYFQLPDYEFDDQLHVLLKMGLPKDEHKLKLWQNSHTSDMEL